jgi:hypothetical protein
MKVFGDGIIDNLSKHILFFVFYYKTLLHYNCNSIVLQAIEANGVTVSKLYQ